MKEDSQFHWVICKHYSFTPPVLATLHLHIKSILLGTPSSFLIILKARQQLLICTCLQWYYYQLVTALPFLSTPAKVYNRVMQAKVLFFMLMSCSFPHANFMFPSSCYFHVLSFMLLSCSILILFIMPSSRSLCHDKFTFPLTCQVNYKKQNTVCKPVDGLTMQ